MKIKSHGAFRTPSGWDELTAWIELHHPSERAHLLTAAMMSWNLAAKVQEMSEEEAFNSEGDIGEEETHG